MDYVIVNWNTKWKIEDVRTYRGVKCSSDL